MGRIWNELLMFLMVVNILAWTEAHKEGKARRRKLESQQEPQLKKNGSSLRMPLDPILTGEATTGSGEMDFDKAIEDMVAQVKSNPALSKTKCVVDRQLWMSNSRSLSPWSYRINHDEKRRPVDIPEAKCSCSGCINPFTMQEDRSMSSALIYTQLPVRRLRCTNRRTNRRNHCVPRYRTVVESIAVGCTCIVG
ncbi:interleukin-17B-like [Hoplias malabaricus]|uniref:interleukin-17B-like n=1 Tax=Hoplias malabaricus TaxID=27720 RepID=UPI0034628E4B